MPALVKSSVGSFAGNSGLERTRVWPCRSKYSRNFSRISDPVMIDKSLACADDGVSTGSDSDRVAICATSEIDGAVTRSLPLPVLTSFLYLIDPSSQTDTSHRDSNTIAHNTTLQHRYRSGWLLPNRGVQSTASINRAEVHRPSAALNGEQRRWSGSS